MSQSFQASLDEVRGLLRAPAPPAERVWPALLAALAFAVCALVLAGAVLVAPMVQLSAPPPAMRGLA
jgi:hypothetical protein